MQAAQKMAAVRVDHVIACFSGGEPRSYGLAGEVAPHEFAVTEQDIARVLAACDVPDLGDAREVLHAHPVNFALDHRTGPRRSARADRQSAGLRHAPSVGRRRRWSRT